MFKKFFFFVGCAFLFANPIYANVSQFVFTTNPQTVAPNVISAIITITSQDSSGTKQNISDTMYVSFMSSSVTGQFLNASGSPLTMPITMAKNSANKNFYYLDTTVGTHIITANVALIKGGPIAFTTNQQIIIGSSPETSTSTSSTATSTSSVTISNDPSPNVSQMSATYYPVPVSTEQAPIQFEISAGRDRLSSVGNEVLFKAVITKGANLNTQNIQYVWTFGDGSGATGKDVTHIYRFPGQYEVVLNASYSDFLAVSRAKATIIKIILSLTPITGGVEIKNNSSGEINLGNWILRSDAMQFIIPQDTIIGSSKSVIFPQQITGISTSDLSLFNPLGTEISSTVPISVSNTIIAVQNQAQNIITTPASSPREEKTEISKVAIPAIVVSQNKTDTKNPTSPKKGISSTISNQNTGTSSNLSVATVYVGASQSSVLDVLFNFPHNGWDWLKSLFGSKK